MRRHWFWWGLLVGVATSLGGAWRLWRPLLGERALGPIRSEMTAAVPPAPATASSGPPTRLCTRVFDVRDLVSEPPYSGSPAFSLTEPADSRPPSVWPDALAFLRP